MKKISILFLVGLLGLATTTSAAIPNGAYSYNDSFIFTERGVEFAIYPNGEFDFYYNPQLRNSKNIVINTPKLNISFNSGYNYDPYVQYDDYGAVIQIEQVPVFYDYYGRIVQAGGVFINYNNYGYIASVGNLFIQYDPYHKIAGYRGSINRLNPYYVYRPWHQYYTRPANNLCIVYNQPYRRYYEPRRLTYTKHKTYYKKNHNSREYRNFYRPQQRVESYDRGRIVTQERKIRSNRNTSQNKLATSNRSIRSNSTRSLQDSRSTRENAVISNRDNKTRSQREQVAKNRNSSATTTRAISNSNSSYPARATLNSGERNRSVPHSSTQSSRSSRDNRTNRTSTQESSRTRQTVSRSQRTDSGNNSDNRNITRSSRSSRSSSRQ